MGIDGRGLCGVSKIEKGWQKIRNESGMESGDGEPTYDRHMFNQETSPKHAHLCFPPFLFTLPAHVARCTTIRLA